VAVGSPNFVADPHFEMAEDGGSAIFVRTRLGNSASSWAVQRSETVTVTVTLHEIRSTKRLAAKERSTYLPAIDNSS
jgi:hypothetical protein